MTGTYSKALRPAKAILAALALGSGLHVMPAVATADNAVTTDQVKQTYVTIAEAMYTDALTAAQTLDDAIAALIASPNDATLIAARNAWKAARVPYQQTEGLRFANPVVDDWEGKVNAWPLDEGLIDYVAPAYGDSSDENPSYTLNVIANPSFTLNGELIDASIISKDLLAAQLHEAQGVDANVATGYHAIEFLLWGQDLNGTGPGAGDRPATDFDINNCTGGNCDRRAAYLKTASALLIDDLNEMVTAWSEDGAARTAYLGRSDHDALSTILTGLGSLSYGELAGERIKLGLLLHDPEEEHDCFSDNTHNSHYYNQVGMIALYQGRYERPDGTLIEGPSIADLGAAIAPDEAAALTSKMSATLAAMDVMKQTADSGRMAYDQMIGEGNDEGNQTIRAIVNALVAQAREIERLVAALNLQISVEGSDSLDRPETIQ